MSLYTYSGDQVQPTVQEISADNYSVSYGRYGSPGANYTLVRVFQTKTDGTKQYPFVFAPAGANAGTQSVLEMNASRNFPIAINAGFFDTTTIKPKGTVIKDSTLIQQGDETLTTWEKANCMTLTINNQGELGYAAYSASGSTLISNGMVSALLAFCPIVIDYEDASETISCDYLQNDADAQRQVIGQFGNGDYAIITSEARTFQNSTGLTIPQMTTLCLSLGLKFAFALDGGGSAQTVLLHKHLNSIYERNVGRIVPTFIVFNGSTTYGLLS